MTDIAERRRLVLVGLEAGFKGMTHKASSLIEAADIGAWTLEPYTVIALARDAGLLDAEPEAPQRETCDDASCGCHVDEPPKPERSEAWEAGYNAVGRGDAERYLHAKARSLGILEDGCHRKITDLRERLDRLDGYEARMLELCREGQG